VTLIVVGNSDGQRRCDARCHNASEAKCDCVCGGRNHGLGAGALHAQMARLLGEEVASALERCSTEQAMALLARRMASGQRLLIPEARA